MRTLGARRNSVEAQIVDEAPLPQPSASLLASWEEYVQDSSLQTAVGYVMRALLQHEELPRNPFAYFVEQLRRLDVFLRM